MTNHLAILYVALKKSDVTGISIINISVAV